MIFVVLIAAALAVGRFVVPRDLAAPTTTSSATPGPTTPTTGAGGSATLSPLPTPPARPADALAAWAAPLSDKLAIPEVAVQAYGYAQLALQRADPGCHLNWTTIAGVAAVSSHHGQLNGAVLLASGRSDPAVVGPSLDGKSGRALVRDSDAGAFDGDTKYDRAMGPLLLMPSVWRTQSIDADADGILDPFDIDDASLALARLLCAGERDLRKAADWNAAIGAYHPGAAYARLVFKTADNYGQQSQNTG